MPTPLRKHLVLWLCIGQSNQLGYIDDSSYYTSVGDDKRLLIWDVSGGNPPNYAQKSTEWVSLADYPSMPYGTEKGFIRRYSRLMNEGATYGVFKFAIGGRAISWFYDSAVSNYWDEIKAELATAIATAEADGYFVEIRGLDFLQGYSDAIDETLAAAYEQNLRDLIDDYRSEFGELIVALADHPADGTNAEYGDVVRNAMSAVASSTPRCEVASTDGVVYTADDTHYESKSKELIGMRMANAVSHI